jgi:Tol biopolymer transport system component
MRKDPSWTPDGSRIVYSETTEDFDFFSTSIVSQSPIAGAADRQVLWSTTRSCEFVGDPEQNAAGTLVFVYYPYSSSCTLVQTIARSTPRGIAKIIYTPITNIYSPTWSPSGAQIAFLELDVTGVGGDITVSVRLMDSDGSNVRTVTTDVHHGSFSEFGFSLCWSADALRLFFNRRDTSSTSHIYSVNVADGTVTQITSAAGVRDGSVSCSA